MSGGHISIKGDALLDESYMDSVLLSDDLPANRRNVLMDTPTLISGRAMVLEMLFVTLCGLAYLAIKAMPLDQVGTMRLHRQVLAKLGDSPCTLVVP
eukprot:6336170-Amphidinium_carterae.1